jgi:hypothetical protein
MADDLLAHARNQAEQALPPVRAAAWLRIARVQSAAAPGPARITFEMALEEIRSLPARDRDFFFQDAQKVAPAFVREIPPPRGAGRDFHAGTLVNIILQHDRIPDEDLRLFARIELAAALAGLPEFPETQRTQRRPPDGLNRNRER